MTTSSATSEGSVDSIQVRISDILRAGKKGRGVAVERHQRQIRRAIMNLLQAAEIGPDTELTLRRCGKDIVVSPTDSGHVANDQRELDNNTFEQCLADVLARRASALQRLAE